jgi:hypothetical protein
LCDDPYWTTRKNSLELIELSSINKVSLVSLFISPGIAAEVAVAVVNDAEAENEDAAEVAKDAGKDLVPGRGPTRVRRKHRR